MNTINTNGISIINVERSNFMSRMIYKIQAAIECLNPKGFNIESSVTRINDNSQSVVVIDTPYKLYIEESKAATSVYGLATINDKGEIVSLGKYVRTDMNSEFVEADNFLFKLEDPLAQGLYLIDSRTKRETPIFTVDVEHDIEAFVKLNASTIKQLIERV